MKNSNYSMNGSWYSARGAKRGFTLAIIAAVLWLCWAIGFIQGYDQHKKNITPMSFEIAPATIPRNESLSSQSLISQSI